MSVWAIYQSNPDLAAMAVIEISAVIAIALGLIVSHFIDWRRGKL
jgi:hypothetical protein